MTGSEEDSVAISVVVPVYQEETSIKPFLNRLRPLLARFGRYEILFCLDPCADRTEAVISREAELDPQVGLLVFSRRFGQPAATVAGILNCRGDTCVVIDVDLQDPPELIPALHSRLAEGYEVVTAQRLSRKGETWLKRLVSAIGYKVINRIADVRIPPNTGDFRIISRRVIEELREIEESHGFLRGLVALVGFRQAFVSYEREARFAGKGNYNRYLGSLKIGFNGVFGFSTYPLSLMLWTGFFVAIASVFMIVLIIALKIFLGNKYPMGIPTITILVLFMGGIQLMSVGVLGEYIGRIYDEVRRRPHFVIDRAVNVAVRDSHRPGSGDHWTSSSIPKSGLDRPLAATPRDDV